MWIADAAAMVHVSSNQDDFTSYRDIKAFRNNTIKGVGEGDFMANIEYEGRVTRICLTQVMHILDVEGKILSLKQLDQKGFERCIIAGCI